MILISALALIPLLATGWIRTYGEGYGYEGYSVRQTSDGGYIIVGMCPDSGDTIADLYLVKADSLGDTAWTKIYGSATDDEGHCIQQAKDGGYIILGFMNIEGEFWPAGDIWLLKTDAWGDTMWTRIYRGYNFPVGGWVEQTSDGGYIFTSNWDMAYLLLLKTDKDGNTEWSKNYQWGSEKIETGYCVRQTKDGGYIVATNMGLFKTDENGDSMWLKSFPSGCVEQTFDEGYIQATSHNQDIWIIKTDWKGDTVWTKTYGGPAEEYSYDVHQTTDGGYIIVGVTTSFGAGNYDIWLLKTDANGDTIWTRLFGGERADWANSVQQTTDEGYILTGWGSSFGGGVLLIKTDSLGYVGIEEPVPVTHLADWEVISPIGQEVVLRYHDKPGGFHAKIYDISGKKCDECNSNLTTSSIRWGKNVPRGVYFIKEVNSPRGYGISRVIILP